MVRVCGNEFRYLLASSFLVSKSFEGDDDVANLTTLSRPQKHTLGRSTLRGAAPHHVAVPNCIF